MNQKTLSDNLHTDRIVVGCDDNQKESTQMLADFLLGDAREEKRPGFPKLDILVLLTHLT